jgi:eukaryotic-like serine/threonine-protein kinase
MNGRLLQDRYRIVEPIAAGGMGVVYKAERVGLGRHVAIKFLHARAASNPSLRKRFETEARAASRMNHPSCVAVIDFGLEDDCPYIVMDFVAGRTLRTMLDRGPLPVPRALAIARQVIAGLAHAHAHGVIHRDLKPENILVAADALGEHALLGDFGCARIGGEMRSISRNMAIGTPSYMAPEQTLGASVDTRTDVYGAGVLLYELLADRKPFESRKPFDLMALHRDAPVPWFDDVAPERAIPPAIEAVVRRALAKSPDARYRSAIELGRALDDAMAVGGDDSDDDITELLVRVGARRPWGGFAAAAALVAPIAVALWLAL